MKTKVLFFAAVLMLWVPITTKAQVNAQDSLALVALYNVTNGSNWSICCNQNWLTTPVNQWEGITVVNNRVVEIDLATAMPCSGYCGLSGTIPSEIGNLTELTYLDLSNNPNLVGTIPLEIGNLIKLTNLRIIQCGLTGSVPQINNLVNIQQLDLTYNKIADLPIFPNFPNAWSISFAYNKLTFEDIEPNISLSSFNYLEQDSVNYNIDTIIDLHDTISITTTVGGTYNLYQWYHNGVSITNANDSVFTINNFSVADTGQYTCAITNSIVPNLTLLRRTINLRLDSLNNIYDNQLFGFNIKVLDNIIEIKTDLDNCNAVLYTFDGKFLLSIKLIQNCQNKISLNNLPKGILLLKISNDKNILTRKIVNF